MSNRDAWIKRLESEVIDLNELRKRIRVLKRKLSWLKVGYRFGDMVDVPLPYGKKHGVVTGYYKELSRVSVINDGKISGYTVLIDRAELPVIGRYSGPGLPPKPPEAEWAEKVLDGEIPLPEDPDEKCDFCGLSYDVSGSNEQSEGFCWCTHCARCDAPIGDTSDLYCDACSREAETPEDYDEQD